MSKLRTLKRWKLEQDRGADLREFTLLGHTLIGGAREWDSIHDTITVEFWYGRKRVRVRAHQAQFKRIRL